MRSTRACLMSHYLKKKGLVGVHRNEGAGMGRCQMGGHVTPSFRTDDRIEFKSNVNLQVSLV